MESLVSYAVAEPSVCVQIEEGVSHGQNDMVSFIFCPGLLLPYVTGDGKQMLGDSAKLSNSLPTFPDCAAYIYTAFYAVWISVPLPLVLRSKQTP